MARRHWPWDVLGIDRTADKAAIRSAYAVRLKAMDVDADIKGFAELRGARDQALREADYAAQEPLDDPLLDAEPDEHEHEHEHEDAGARDPEAPEGDWSDDGIEPWYVDHDDIARLDPAWDNTFGYGTGDYADPGTRLDHFDDDAAPAERPDRALVQLLYPAGEYSQEAFTHEENEAAQAALDALLTDAKSADLGREQAVDQWLGELLAECWPRSAPLLERTAETFDWLAQSGEIGERPALQFLNPRLRGMRFVSKVELPDHPFHKYWEELKRPGKRGFVDRFRIKRDGIENLLSGIRSRYPEVESYLDHERVASWEKPAPSWIVWVVQRIFIFIVVVQLLAFCGRTFDEPGLPTEDLNRVVAEAFGPGYTMAKVQAADPKLADMLEQTISEGADKNETTDQIADRVTKRLRGLAVIAMQDAPKDDLLAILTVRRDLFAAAEQGGGTTACAQMLKLGGLLVTTELGDEPRAKEQALFVRLAQADRLSGTWRASKADKVALPPWVGPGVAERTGLSAERINAVLKGEETADLCAVRIALIDTVLSRPDVAPVELLRIL